MRYSETENIGSSIYALRVLPAETRLTVYRRLRVSGADPPEFSERGQEGANANIVDDTLMHKDSAEDQEMTSAPSVDETLRCPVIGCRNEWDIVGGRTYVNRAKNVQQAVRINGLCNLHHHRLRRDMKDKAQNTFERRRLRLWTHAEIEEDPARRCAFRE